MKKLCVLSLLILMAAGCGQRPGLGNTPARPTALLTPTGGATSPPPTPTPVLGPTPVPTPVPTKGAITGQLIGRESGEPEGGLIVFLGEVSYLEPDLIPVITMRQQSSPNTMTDESGRFAFVDLEPGSYALILWTPANSVVVDQPETGEGLFVTVEAGSITDIGGITVNLP